MKINSLIQKIGASAPFLGGKKRQGIASPALIEPLRCLAGTMQFTTTDEHRWTQIGDTNFSNFLQRIR
jgi:hypothetical protein